MLITKSMMGVGGMTPEFLKLWVKAMSEEVKKEKPGFCLASDGVYAVRARLAVRTPARLTNLNLAKGEEFQLDSVYQEPNIHRDEVTITLVFTPVTAKLKEEGVLSMTVPLSDAETRFEGLTEWSDAHALDIERTIADGVAAAPKVIVPPTPEEHQSNEAWGAW